MHDRLRPVDVDAVGRSRLDAGVVTGVGRLVLLEPRVGEDLDANARLSRHDRDREQEGDQRAEGEGGNSQVGEHG